MPTAPRLIALTGGIATGKSTVARELAALGAAVVDADAIAHEVVEPGTPGLAEVREAFGDGVVHPDGSLDRAAVAAIVFADAGARRRLEAITHPRIRDLMQQRTAAALAGPAPLVVVDVPLLYEGGLEAMFPAVMVVATSPEEQVRRLTARDGMPLDQARARIAAQLPIGDKRTRATWVIDNDGTVAQTAAAVRRWWTEHVGGG